MGSRPRCVCRAWLQELELALRWDLAVDGIGGTFCYRESKGAKERRSHTRGRQNTWERMGGKKGGGVGGRSTKIGPTVALMCWGNILETACPGCPLQPWPWTQLWVLTLELAPQFSPLGNFQPPGGPWMRPSHLASELIPAASCLCGSGQVPTPTGTWGPGRRRKPCVASMVWLHPSRHPVKRPWPPWPREKKPVMESHLSVGISHLEKGWQFHTSQNYFTLVFTTGYAILIHPEGTHNDSFTRVYHIEDLVAPRFRSIREQQSPSLRSAGGDGLQGEERESAVSSTCGWPWLHTVRATLRTSPPQDATPPMPLQLQGAGLLCWLLGLGSWVGKGSPQLLPGLGGAIHLAKEMGCSRLGSQEHLAWQWKVAGPTELGHCRGLAQVDEGLAPMGSARR